MYDYTVPTRKVSRVYNFPATLWLQCVIHVMLFHKVTFCTFTLVLSQVGPGLA